MVSSARYPGSRLLFEALAAGGYRMSRRPQREALFKGKRWKKNIRHRRMPAQMQQTMLPVSGNRRMRGGCMMWQESRSFRLTPDAVRATISALDQNVRQQMLHLVCTHCIRLGRSLE